MSGRDLCELSLVEAADAIRHGEVTSVELTQHAIARLERYGPHLNCTISIDRSALDAAEMLDGERKQNRLRGPLHGVPLAHKDLFYRAGYVVTCGSLILKDQVATTTASVLDRLDRAGAVNVGTLNLSEFAFSPTGFNKHFGSCRNPWKPAHVSGGSSSGSSAAVAARLVYGSLGTDSGGSIRHPAAMCGVVGLKTTQTRVSRAGVMPLSHSLDCVGPIARTARDCARLLTVISGPDTADPTASQADVPDYEAALIPSIKGLKIALPRAYYYDLVSDDVRAILDESVAVLKDLGAVVRETPVPDIALINALAQTVMSVEAATVHQLWLRTRRDDYAEVVRSRIEPGLLIPATRYCEALALRARVTAAFLDTCLADCDAIHIPAISIPVPTIHETTDDEPAAVARRLGALTHATRGINYLGLPALSVPAGFTRNGLPAAFQLVGRPFDEALLLQIAHAYQQSTPWHLRMPSL
jgi:aspartyl-tRNA(Asn)/glutamyl-tRNA(Gln) amidotransferase subunit A